MTDLTPSVTYRHVLVPLDGSEDAAAATPTAVELARRFGAELHAVTVAASDDEAAELRERVAARLNDPSRLDVVVSDDPVGVISHRAAELGDSLVCMSTRGRGRVAGAVVGSVAREVLQTLETPLVVVGPRVADVSAGTRTVHAPLSVARMIACVDGSAESETVIPVAAVWAKALDMSLTVATVAEPIPPPMDDRRWHRHIGPHADAEKYIAEVLDRFSRTAEGATGQVIYDPISAGDGLRTYLEREPAGMLAVTTHARSGLERVLLGAGAANIIVQSPVPVLVVPLGG